MIADWHGLDDDLPGLPLDDFHLTLGGETGRDNEVSTVFPSETQAAAVTEQQTARDGVEPLVARKTQN